MKVLLINGSPHEKGCTYTALKEVAGALEKNGIETQIFHIGKGMVHGCVACGACALHTPLKRMRLPIPPPPRERGYYSKAKF